MNISGLPSVSAVQAPHQQDLELRLFQRVSAQVLSVNGTTALLSIDGFLIVAQLASADEAATLLSQQTAQFIVTQRTSERVTLKVVNDGDPPTTLAGSGSQGPELAVRLLVQQNIPVSANHLTIARELLKRHLPITPLLIDELSETLSASGSWGRQEATLAAALKAAGLPLTHQSLELASRQAAQIGDSLTRLIRKLTDSKGQDLPDELLKQLVSSIKLLHTLVLDVGGESSQLAEQLKVAVSLLGKSIEHVLQERIQNSDSLPENNLLTLARFQQQLEQAGKQELAGAFGDFLKDIQWNQFLNSKPDQNSETGTWMETAFAVQALSQHSEEKLSSARLRIARKSGNDAHEINLAHSRLILQVDLSSEQTVEVDLSIVDKQIRTSVLAPDTSWCQQAQDELPGLEQALQGLGFTLKDARINVGKPIAFEQIKKAHGLPLMTVDIEV